jgi:fluoroquinolone transport system permease protein
MKRLLATIKLDLRLQFRNGFYYASLFMAVVLVTIFSLLPAADMRRTWPAMILFNLVINSYYFMSGLVMLEKGEGTLEVQVVTPLRREEYLLSKMLTLAALSIVETLLIVVVMQGIGFNWIALIVGILVMTAIYSGFGFIAVARYDSINEFLMPSMLWVIGFSLPLIDYFGLWRSWIFYLHPLQAPLLLLRAAFEPVAGWQIAYGLIAGAAWGGVTYLLSLRAFNRFVLMKARAH